MALGLEQVRAIEDTHRNQLPSICDLYSVCRSLGGGISPRININALRQLQACWKILKISRE